MITSPEAAEMFRESRKTNVSGVFEISEENMKTLREVYEDGFDIMCPLPDTTFEEFCGYMIVAGTNAAQEKLKEIVEKAMKEAIREALGDLGKGE